MESFDLLNNDLQVSASAQSFLSDSARWGKFLAIIGFIFCGFMIVIAFFVPALIMNLPPYNAMASGLSASITAGMTVVYLSLIHISEPTRRTPISYAVFCLKKRISHGKTVDN